ALDVKQQYPIKVFDEDGTLIGDYYADLLVDGWLIVELKTAKAVADEHVAQVLGYLAVSNTVCSSTSAPISSRCASLPGRKTRPDARASTRSFYPLSLRSLRSVRFNRRRILSCAPCPKRETAESGMQVSSPVMNGCRQIGSSPLISRLHVRAHHARRDPRQFLACLVVNDAEQVIRSGRGQLVRPASDDALKMSFGIECFDFAFVIAELLLLQTQNAKDNFANFTGVIRRDGHQTRDLRFGVLCPGRVAANRHQDRATLLPERRLQFFHQLDFAEAGGLLHR